MSFKLFIYYCALSGGWAAFVAFLLVQATGLRGADGEVSAAGLIVRTAVISTLLGILLAGAVGAVDALLNAVGQQRVTRVLVCVSVGLAGGLLGGVVGAVLCAAFPLPRFIGWTLVGTAIGASVGVFDLTSAVSAGQPAHTAWGKIRNGLLGGALGGFVGGLLFVLIETRVQNLPRTGLAFGFVILGVCIGLLIGLAQVILREAWVRIESGRRAGREMMLSKSETTIGRAEGNDVGLFGDPAVEKVHARILLQGQRYVLVDAGTPGGTFVNDQRIAQPTPLRSGDRIRVGGSTLRFGERRKETAKEQPQK